MMLAALILAPVAARANDPNYKMTMMVHTKGLTSEYAGDVRITYTFDGKTETHERRAIGGLPARFTVPSMAKNLIVEGKFTKIRGSSAVTATQHFAWVNENVTLDFSGKVK